MIKRALYPGSFDPITLGHLDIARRASHLFDEVIIAVAYNEKKKALFNIEERVNLIKESLKERNMPKNVHVTSYTCLTIEFAKSLNVSSIIRGLRVISDFEFEFQMALTNRRMDPRIETVFLMTHEDYSYISSTIIKEIASLNGNVTPWVTDVVKNALNEKLLGREGKK
ncbi:Phosphopantetheine adenylyltransferase [Thermodesulfobium narugense DSM 14796]|uniref:Phosphopantetheine adenylyltransferase n=1 Tax=Thermodesulfobium narugense DSM 14796 TaxID=747365 RepID=M1E8G5_9BACT|nr:pantetheine-phosphate adenylyltransferase [Thermodesulfobium narugense]AEE15158.1 Phosphopantetheine adenylyltransferase [Thermodesulfobium narugense DSM 14796]